LEAMGGGRLGANGSHQIDLIRWWLGEVGAVCGQVKVVVADRIDKQTGERWTATADDLVHFTLEMASGALVTVFLSGVARHTMDNHTQIFGSEGTLLLANNNERLLYARAGEDFKDISEHDPNADLPGIGKGIWNVSVVGLMRELTSAIREGRPLREGATFYDGLQTQIVMDAVRQSTLERRWILLN
jgi:predicted dehydrogenase